MTVDRLISVVIPVYNGERYLVEALSSVVAQTYPWWEIIVVDDGSTDATAQVVQACGYPIQYVWQEHNGAAAARNRGVALARGAFVAFLDADDLWSESKLKRQLALWDNDPTVDLVFGHVQQFVSPELPVDKARQHQVSDVPLTGESIGTMLLRRETFWRVGTFNTAYRIGEFIDWYARAVELKLKSLMLPEVVLHRRIHSANQGITQQSWRTDYVRILKAALDRRRQDTSPA